MGLRGRLVRPCPRPPDATIFAGSMMRMKRLLIWMPFVREYSPAAVAYRLRCIDAASCSPLNYRPDIRHSSPARCWHVDTWTYISPVRCGALQQAESYFARMSFTDSVKPGKIAPPSSVSSEPRICTGWCISPVSVSQANPVGVIEHTEIRYIDWHLMAAPCRGKKWLHLLGH